MIDQKGVGLVFKDFTEVIFKVFEVLVNSFYIIQFDIF